jgi:hypothetical protein
MRPRIYSLRLENASNKDWTFFVYQAPATDDNRIASLVWIATPSVVPVGTHAMLMWNSEPRFIWCTHSEHPTQMPFTASGQRGVNLKVNHGVLFNQDNNAPSFEPCTEMLVPGPGPWTIEVAANVPDHTYSIGTCMDGAGTLISTAMMSQRYDFTPGYWIGAGTDVSAACVVDSARSSPRLAVSFPANVYDLSFYLDEKHRWHPSTHCSPAAGCVGADPLPPGSSMTFIPPPKAGFPRSALTAAVQPHKEKHG